MRRIRFARALMVLGIGCTASMMALAFAQQAPRTQTASSNSAQVESHSLNLKLYEKHDSRMKVLADPTIVAVVDRPFSFVAGGEVDKVLPKLEFGTHVHGNIAKGHDDRFRLSLEISIGNLVKLDDPSIEAVKKQALDLRIEMAKGDSKSIQVDETTWCDIHFE